MTNGGGRPVVIHAAVSLDARASGFAAQEAVLRRLARTWPGARVIAGGDAVAAELLAQGLVDEVSLLIHPVIVGEGHDAWSGGGRLPAALRLVRRSAERVEPGLAWIRFDVSRTPGAAGDGRIS